MKYIVSETKLLYLANVAQPDVVRNDRKNLGRASMPAVKRKIIDNINVSRYYEL